MLSSGSSADFHMSLIWAADDFTTFYQVLTESADPSILSGLASLSDLKSERPSNVEQQSSGQASPSGPENGPGRNSPN